MQTKFRLLRFLLVYGHTIDVIESTKNASDYYTKWKSGAFALQGDKRVSGVDQVGREWALMVDEVVGILVQDLPEEVQKQVTEFFVQNQQAGVRWPVTGGR